MQQNKPRLNENKRIGGSTMIRARFYTAEKDYRPIKWPIKYPYWCSGETAELSAILIAYADTLRRNI